MQTGDVLDGLAGTRSSDQRKPVAMPRRIVIILPALGDVQPDGSFGSRVGRPGLPP